MCGSMADIQSAVAEIRRGKKMKKKEEQTRAGSVWIFQIRFDSVRFSV